MPVPALSPERTKPAPRIQATFTKCRSELWPRGQQLSPSPLGHPDLRPPSRAAQSILSARPAPSAPTLLQVLSVQTSCADRTPASWASISRPLPAGPGLRIHPQGPHAAGRALASTCRSVGAGSPARPAGRPPPGPAGPVLTRLSQRPLVHHSDLKTTPKLPDQVGTPAFTTTTLPPPPLPRPQGLPPAGATGLCIYLSGPHIITSTSLS